MPHPKLTFVAALRGPQHARRVATGLLCLVLAGCGDPIVAAGPDDVPNPTDATPAADPNAENAGQGEVDQGAVAAGSAYEDEAFVEVDKQQRDPFRDFSVEWRTPQTPTQGPVRVRKLGDVAVDDMRVIGIVLGAAPARAMIVGPDGAGTAVRPRDYLGRTEYVQVGGAGEDGVQVALNWRVDRIRQNQVVLTRENPQAPDQPPLQRTLVLRSEDELDVMRLGSVAPLAGAAAPLPELP